MLVSLVTKYTNCRDNTVAAGGNDVTDEGQTCIYNSRVSEFSLFHSVFYKGNHYFVIIYFFKNTSSTKGKKLNTHKMLHEITAVI